MQGRGGENKPDRRHHPGEPRANQEHTRAHARANPKKIYLCGVKIRQTKSNETNQPRTLRETMLQCMELTDPETGRTYRESLCLAALANASKPTTAGTRERNLLYRLLGADQVRKMFERYANGNGQNLNDCNQAGTETRPDAETLKNSKK